MRRPPWRWRDLLFDVTPVVVLLIVGLLDVAAELSSPYGDAPSWTAIPLVVLACLALLLRRRWPLVTLGVMPGLIALVAVAVPVQLTYWGQFVPWLVGMYSAGRHLPWRRGLWAIPISAAAYALLLLAYPAMRAPGDVLFNAAVLLGLWAIGRLTASWSAYRDRSLRLEFERAQAEERAAVRERARIARELHDVISHTITVIVMQAGGARLGAANDPAAAIDALTRIEALGRDSLAELRTLLTLLREDAPEAGETAPQPTLADLPELCERMRSLGLPVRLQITGTVADLGPGVQLTGYRIVQESLTNVLKHAGTVETEVTVARADAPSALLVEVSRAGGDAASPLPGGSRGLLGLRERVDALGGSLRTGTRPDGGFVLTADLPLTEAVA